MKTKLFQFEQYLSHSIEIEDDEKVEDYLDKSLPLVGLIVIF